MSIDSVTKLAFNDECGTTAKDGYIRFAKRYGWDMSKASNFGPRMLLYARSATPEGYSPWFVAHSNFISLEDTNGRWLNRFEKDLLFEEWLPNSQHYLDEMRSDNTIRIVFVKKQSGKYYFMGAYKPISIEKNKEGNYVKTYQKISTTYPFFDDCLL